MAGAEDRKDEGDEEEREEIWADDVAAEDGVIALDDGCVLEDREGVEDRDEDMEEEGREVQMDGCVFVSSACLVRFTLRSTSGTFESSDLQVLR